MKKIIVILILIIVGLIFYYYLFLKKDELKEVNKVEVLNKPIEEKINNELEKQKELQSIIDKNNIVINQLNIDLKSKNKTLSNLKNEIEEIKTKNNNPELNLFYYKYKEIEKETDEIIRNLELQLDLKDSVITDIKTQYESCLNVNNLKDQEINNFKISLNGLELKFKKSIAKNLFYGFVAGIVFKTIIGLIW